MPTTTSRPAGNGLTALLRHRFAAQHLSTGKAESPHAAVRRLLAVQAQDYHAALWAVGLRTSGATAATVEQALSERRIVRTWPMRGTLHLVAAEDVRWLQGLLAPRALARDGNRHEREYGLDTKAMRECRRAVERILRDGEPMPRPALYAALEADGIATGGSRGLHILMRLAHEGLICQGPRVGKQPGFVWLDAWLPPTPPLSREEALAELARRYIAGHGPATAHDLAWWSGLTLTDAKAALASVTSGLVGLDIDGIRHWQSHNAAAASSTRGVLLLPAFDEYLLGYKDRTPVLDPDHHRKVFTINGLIHPTVVAGGRVAGIWPRAAAEFEPNLFRPLGEAETRSLKTASERHEQFWKQ
ncbi:winged helix DNA-binding domain-containing protein [Marilutibacter alkalisoli]|nr:winged helix DNA-binding domain-containing protein [Lysobacter alkalisoli]